VNHKKEQRKGDGLGGRLCGILLHPTSLPGPYGIGDLGYNAVKFLDFLHLAKQRIWQVLPLGPTGYGDSPYASPSSFAGNTLLISPDLLFDSGFLSEGELQNIPDFPDDNVDYGKVIPWKREILKKAALRFLSNPGRLKKNDFSLFCQENSFWLEDYAFFMALKNYHDNRAQEEGAPSSLWNQYWDKGLAIRDPEVLGFWEKNLAEEIDIQKVLQFFFQQQWDRLRHHARERGITILGDLPIFVAQDSADLWACREQFLVDERGIPKVVAGVPPDYFSESGQLWGNPLYNWDRMMQDGFSWWIKRLKRALSLCDLVRIDHFRGFVSTWQIPAEAKTAKKGRWVKTPGVDFFKAVEKALGGNLPILAEDLGVITPAVVKLKERFGLPGMRVLQFAFEMNAQGRPNCHNPFLPHNHSKNSVVYTGTHDNDTTAGWYQSLSPEIKDLVRRYFARDDREVVWEMIRSAYASVARMAVIPFQDILMLGSEARMNTPSVASGNWAWRFSWEEVPEWVHCKLKEMVYLYGRHCGGPEDKPPL